jgi:hypothetical protein
LRFNQKLLIYTVVGVILVSVLGTLLHFAYDWSGQNRIVGLFTPVNESIWEHMKLLFFPMLFYVLFEYCQLKNEFPGILWSGFTGVLAGTFAIPLLYYGYTGIIGRNYMVADIAIYYISVIIGFCINYFGAEKEYSKGYKRVVTLLMVLMTVAFVVFTYNPPNGRVFLAP